MSFMRSAANMMCERGGRGRGNDASHVFFFIATAMVPSRDGALPGLGALLKQHTLHISIVNIAQTEPQRKGTLASDLKEAGARAPLPPLVHATGLAYTQELTDKEKYFMW